MNMTKEQLMDSWITGNEKLLQADLLANVGKVKCGVIDKYMVVIVPEPFVCEGLQILNNGEEKRVEAMMIYKGYKFASTFPYQPGVEKVVALAVKE